MTIIVSPSSDSTTTVQNIVNRAARMLGQLQPNTDLGDDETADAIFALNSMLDSWGNDGLMCFAYKDESLTLTANTNPYSIGPGGDLDTTRPVEIIGAYVLASNIRYDVEIIDDGKYDAIGAPTVSSSWPDRINYRPTMDTGTLYVYPPSNGTTATLHLRTRVPLNSVSYASQQIDFPPGWVETLASNLALAMAPEYETVPSPFVVKMAKESKGAIKARNSRPTKGYSELPALVGSNQRGNILTGE